MRLRYSTHFLFEIAIAVRLEEFVKHHQSLQDHQPRFIWSRQPLIQCMDNVYHFFAIRRRRDNFAQRYKTTRVRHSCVMR